MSKRRRNRAGRTIVRRQETPQQETPEKSPEWWARQGAAQPPPPAIGGDWYGQHQATPEEIQWFREQKAANRAREQEYDRLRAGRQERLAAAIKADTERIKAETIQTARIKTAQIETARIEIAPIEAETEQLKANQGYQPDGPGRRYGQKRKKKRRPRKSSFKVAGSHIVLPTEEDLRNIALDSSIAVVGFDKPVKIHSLLTNESYHQSKLLTQADFFCNRIVETRCPIKEFSMMDWWTAPGGRLAHRYHYLSETIRNT